MLGCVFSVCVCVWMGMHVCVFSVYVCVCVQMGMHVCFFSVRVFMQMGMHVCVQCMYVCISCVYVMHVNYTCVCLCTHGCVGGLGYTHHLFMCQHTYIM